MMPPEFDGLGRREFLSRTALAGVAAVLAACGGSDPTGVTNGPASISVTLAEFSALSTVGGIAAVGTVRSSPVAVVRTGATSYLALSRVCTHEGCIINVVSNGFACPCHGSAFNSQGGVTNGPAGSPLGRLTATLSADGTTLTIS
jgi:nitrite reductase/ring-hydroxylating ferredoxin subunit